MTTDGTDTSTDTGASPGTSADAPALRNVERERAEGVSAVRGILIGLLLVTPFWAGVIAAVVWFVNSR